MKSFSVAARIVLFLCLAAILFAALMQPGSLQPLAMIAPLWLFVATAARQQSRRSDAHKSLPSFPILPLFSPRPPPIQ